MSQHYTQILRDLCKKIYVHVSFTIPVQKEDWCINIEVPLVLLVAEIIWLMDIGQFLHVL